MATTKWRITRQDKTRYDNIRELRALLIHQLVLVCWRAVPQTISFYNPEPSYLEMPRHGCTAVLLQRCQVYIAACYNTARSQCCMLQHCQVCTVACCNTKTWQHYWSLLLCCRIQAMTLSPPQATSSRWSRFVRIPLVEPIN
jgi:hypothetical protein